MTCTISLVDLLEIDNLAMTYDGHVYSHEGLAGWLENSNIEPNTGKEIKYSKQVIKVSTKEIEYLGT